MLTSEFNLGSLDDTERFARLLTSFARPPLLIALSGTLGAGKTQLVRFAAQSLGISAEEVTSPTYVLLQRYRGSQLIYHFDFYRLKTAAEVWDLGIDELFEQQAIIFIEWAEKFPKCLPNDYLHIQLTPVELNGNEERLVNCRATGPRTVELLKMLVNAWA